MEKEVFNGTIEVELDDDSCTVISSVPIDEAKLRSDYEIYAAECGAAMGYTLSRIRYVQESLTKLGRHNPIYRIESRIKTFQSAMGKCETRGYSLDIQSIRDNIKDVGGIRIITKYLDEVQEVADILAQLPGINIVVTKDYVTRPKRNGYQSLHLGCQVEIYDPIRGSKLAPVEIQIRTKIMNLWSGYDHDFNYKFEDMEPGEESDDITESFFELAKEWRELEVKMMEFRDRRKVKKTSTTNS